MSTNDCACNDSIYEQLTEYCGCVDVEEKYVEEMIHLVSMATGWGGENPCDTFLENTRREVIDLEPCVDCPIEFKPYYRPFNPDSFSFKLIKIDGLTETATDLDFGYIESEGLFRVDTGLSDCDCRVICGCEPKYKLVVEYTAGYPELPDCLLPVFCNLVEVIHAKNSCDCEECGCETNYGENDQQPIVKYKNGDVVTVFLENDLGKMLVEQYKMQLGMLSIYEPPSRIWGVFA